MEHLISTCLNHGETSYKELVFLSIFLFLDSSWLGPMGVYFSYSSYMTSLTLNFINKLFLVCQLWCQYDSYGELNMGEFNLEQTLRVVINQAMILSQERAVQVVLDFPVEVSTVHLYGDKLRLQQVLSNFLTNVILFTPNNEASSVILRAIPRKERIGMKMHIVHLEFR